MKNSPMAHRTLSLLLGVGAGFYPLQSFGLSLGDLQVDSRLNEALRARIEIVGVTDDEWRQIRASIAPSSYSGDGPDHPEILDVISFRPLEDADHRRFIEMKSTDPLTEPLFDLPIQVSAASVQVIRSYSVLLDPAVRSNEATVLLAQSEAHDRAAVGEATVAVTGAGGSAAAPGPASGGPASTAQSEASAAGARSALPAVQPAKPRGTSRTGKKHRRGSHKRSSSQVAKSSAAPAAGPAPASEKPTAGVDGGVAVEQLKGQLAALQQTLSEMQATIRGQDAQIASLRRAVALAQESPSPATTAPVVANAAADDSDSSDEDSGSPRRSSGIVSKVLLWFGGLAVLMAAVVAGARYMRKRNSAGDREVRSEDIRAEMAELSQGMQVRWTPPADRVSAASSQRTAAADMTAQHEVGRASAVTGTNTATIVRLPTAASNTAASTASSAAAFGTSSTVSTARLPRVDEAIEVSEGEGSFEEEARGSHPGSSGLEDWRTQSALLLADIPTDALVDADETMKLEMTGETLVAEKETNTLSLADLERAAQMPTQGTSALGRAGDAALTRPQATPADHGASNREVAEILENTLDIEPDRVDIQLKLLEIYHQEALGNRDNFHAMLRKLSLDSKTLTPAQLLHIETLQRTLDDGKRAAAVAEIAL